MGVMMGKIVEVNGKEVQLVLQGLDEEDLIKQVDGVNEMEHKAKAFDEVKKFTTERLKEEETTDEYDYGERFMCEEIERLLEDKQNDWLFN